MPRPPKIYLGDGGGRGAARIAVSLVNGRQQTQRPAQILGAIAHAAGRARIVRDALKARDAVSGRRKGEGRLVLPVRGFHIGLENENLDKPFGIIGCSFCPEVAFYIYVFL